MSLKSRLPALSLNFTWYSARGVSGLILPLYLHAIGLSLVQIGIALGISGASLLFFELAWGFVLDRFGVARTLPAVEVISVLTFLFFPLIGTAYEAYVGAFLLGMTSPVMVVVGRALVAGEGRASGWGAGFGMLGSAISLGYGVGALVGGVASLELGYGNAFYIAALLTVLPYPVYVLGKRTQDRREPVETRPAVTPESPGLDWRTLGVLGVVSVPLFMGVAFYSSLMQLVVTQTPSISASNTDAAVMISLFSFSNVVFQPLLGAALARRARSFIATGLALNFLVFLALTQTRSMIGFDVLAVAEAFCFSMVSPLSLSLLMVRTPRRYVGRIMGAYGAAEDVGIVLGPVAGAFVWASIGLQAAYLTIGVPLLAVIFFYVVMSRPR